jgi:FkbM family methyltransferase
MFPQIVIHVGAGSGQRAREFREAGAQRIVLLEAEAATAADLERRTFKDDDIRVLAAAAAEKDGQGVLSIWNVPKLNSLLRTNGSIQELYPNLRLIERQEVRLVGPEHVMAEVGDLRGPIFLILHTHDPASGFSTRPPT